ncbi:MAG TPA: GAF domain-containing protein [Candidatus Acidoferrales bacterium]|nr:GAF domain-containing protein [Candidatus Acidoferrales bacterium]
MTIGLSLISELERLANAVSENSEEAAQVSLSSVAERMARSIGVKTDEVGILGISTRWRHLYFLVPEALRNVGFIPLSSATAIAARTARESRPEIINNFAAVRHASVFESVKLGTDPSALIQKIVSAPILCDGRIVGVIQISRKGPSPVGCGPDFTPDDLGKILALCKPLGKILQHFTAE